MELDDVAHTGTATSRSNDFLQLPSFSYVPKLTHTTNKQYNLRTQTGRSGVDNGDKATVREGAAEGKGKGTTASDPHQ